MSKHLQFYWDKFNALPVIFPFGKFTWTGIYGVQIKGVFIGVIIGKKETTK